jgi:membrane protein DedA with SNARE-associated domain
VGLLVLHFGYAAILVGTFFEGETILILGGLAAHQGYLHLPIVAACAFVGSLAGDQSAFFIGRRRGRGFLSKRPRLHARSEKVTALLERHQTSLTLGFRFLYGLRNVVPFVAGASRMPIPRFVALNAAGAAVWAAAFAAGGYFLGHGLEAVLGEVKRYELAVFGAVLATGAIVWVVRRRKSGKEIHGGAPSRGDDR